MLDMGTIALISLPVTTGLAATLWSIVALKNPLASAALATLDYAIVMAIFWIAGYRFDGVLAGISPAYATMYLVVNAIVLISWVLALKSSGVAAIGFVEIGYPFFILLFSIVLLGSTTISKAQLIGGMIICIGSAIVVFGGNAK